MGWKSREVTSKNIRAYHTKIESLAKPRQRKIMRDLVNAMRNKRMLNVETFWFIIRRHARVQKVEKGRQFTHLMPCRNMMYPNALNGLPSALCKSNNVRKAQEIINSMKDWYITNSKTYNMPLEEPCRLIQKLLPMLVQRSGVKEVLILLGIIGKDQ